MSYVKANAVLPEQLIIEIQKYVQGEAIYIPKPKAARQKWGTRSGSRQQFDARNASIRQAFENGRTLEQLAEDYFLSAETIKKIVYSAKK
ncbi:CD3324 family protein [Bacillus xiapuensis]|uniref:CD3324 family protein n=1 Tax=Bacillus xiapuensis TaxID=2014075 RepID=UPI000C24F113|nr:CD3324 family protein [Bacillus xiapuensis]